MIYHLLEFVKYSLTNLTNQKVWNWSSKGGNASRRLCVCNRLKPVEHAHCLCIRRLKRRTYGRYAGIYKGTGELTPLDCSQLSRGTQLQSSHLDLHYVLLLICHKSSLFSLSEVSNITEMPIDFYQLPGSAPCRGVALAAAALGVKLNFKEVALMKGEHLKPEYLKMNPQHTIPTIDDNGFYLWESRAIMTYLADQYGKNDSLYPKDPKKRALVNQRLYFDACTLYKAFADYYYPVLFAKAPKDQTKFESIGTALGFLEQFLEGQNYVAGSNMTLADLSLTATISTLEAMDYDLSKYKNVSRWFAKMKSEAPKYEEYNNAGIKAFKTMVDSLSKQ